MFENSYNTRIFRVFNVASFLSTRARKKRASQRLALFFQLNPSAVGIANCSDWDKSHYRGMKSLRDEIRLRRDKRTDLISSEAARRRFHPSLLVVHFFYVLQSAQNYAIIKPERRWRYENQY